MGAPIPVGFKDVVAFLYREIEGQAVPIGTGFFVGVRSESNPDVTYVYLATAKHVILRPDGGGFFDHVTVRLNNKEGHSELVGVPVIPEGATKTAFTHNDPSVDLVVISYAPDASRYDFRLIGDEAITTKEDYRGLKISEGSDVFFMGLFIPYVGAERNYPIVRFGRVALVTDEKIQVGEHQMDLYFIEATSYEGNSGAPVFFYLGADREPGSLFVGPPVVKLAGIVMGWFINPTVIGADNSEEQSVLKVNTGISAVVPSYKLHEILFSEELKARRN